MKKADYSALAALIQTQYAGANHCVAQTERTPENKEYFRGAADAADLLARNFAARASVNRAEFLKACGLSP